MGLLEKAGQINTGDTPSVAKPEPQVKPEPVAAEAVAEPEPVESGYYNTVAHEEIVMLDDLLLGPEEFVPDRKSVV